MKTLIPEELLPLLQDLGEQVLEGAPFSQCVSGLCGQMAQRFESPLVWVAIRESGGDLSVYTRTADPGLNPDSFCLTDEERHGVDSVLSTDRTLHLQVERDRVGETSCRVGGRSYPAQLMIPLRTRDLVVGVLALYGPRRDTFDASTIQWVEILARHVSIILALAMVRKETAARVFHLAHHDPLTDLPNRILFADRLKQALAWAKRYGRGVGVLFVDLDHFKAINDALGHETGDALLKIVADRLVRCVRRTDTIARLSGDEFAMVLSDLAQGQDAGSVAQKVLNAVGRPAIVGDRTIPITASVGIALYPVDATEPDALIAQADRAMYRVKKKGGQGYQFVSVEMNVPVPERLPLEKGRDSKR